MKLGPLLRPAFVAGLLLAMAAACTKDALTKPTADAAMDAPGPVDLSPADTVATPEASPQEIVDASRAADVVVPRLDVGLPDDASLDHPPEDSPPSNGNADAPFVTGEAGDTRTLRSETATSEPTPLAPLTVSPTSVNMGKLPIGTAQILTFTVTATSAIADLVVQGVGDNVGLDPSGTCGATLAAGASCTVVVRYVVAGAYNPLNYVSLSAGGGTVTAGIFAEGVTSGLVISPVVATVTSAPNVPSAPMVFTVTNQSDVAATLGFTIDGNDVGDFDFGNGNCFVQPYLPPRSSCTTTLVFTPAPTGAATRYANLTVSATGNEADGAIASLIGTVRSSAPLAITPSQSDFGAVQVGVIGPGVVFTVRNPGSTSSSLLAVSVSSPEFVVMSDTCSGNTLAPAAACTVGLALWPATAGAKTAVLAIGGATGAGVVITLTGVGVTPSDPVATPSSLNFGSVPIGTVSAPQTVTIANSGGVATGPLSFLVAGSPASYAVTANACSGPLAPGASCSFSVVFAPTTAGGNSATITVTDGMVALTIPVSGTTP
jgi:hypothetical protein